MAGVKIWDINTVADVRRQTVDIWRLVEGKARSRMGIIYMYEGISLEHGSPKRQSGMLFDGDEGWTPRLRQG
jgi:hypothetical protein